MHSGKFQEAQQIQGGGNPILNIRKANCWGRATSGPPEINPAFYIQYSTLSTKQAWIVKARSYSLEPCTPGTD